MVIFKHRNRLREAEGYIRLEFVYRLVLTVAPLSLQMPKHGLSQRRISGSLRNVITDTVLVIKDLLGELTVLLKKECKLNARIDNSLTAQNVNKEFTRYVYVGKDIAVGQPAYDGTCTALVFGKLAHAQLAHRTAETEAHESDILTVKGIDLHVFRSALRGKRAETVETERIFIRRRLGVVVHFTACVRLAEDKIPVVSSLFFVIVHRDASAVVVHLDGMILKDRDLYLAAIALARLVNGVRKYLKKGMLAAVKSVRTENDARAQTHAVRPLEHYYTLIVILFGLFTRCAFCFFSHIRRSSFHFHGLTILLYHNPPFQSSAAVRSVPISIFSRSYYMDRYFRHGT